MDKRYQVFVSSTYEDLKEERQNVIQALLELDCIPAGMELFPAADEDQWTLIQKVINDCDYYIVIIGGRYGSQSPSGISYTQMEYDYAVSKGKPVIGFIHKNPGSIQSSKTEQSDEGRARLETFRDIVQKKMCKYWTSPAELGSVVSRSLVKLIKNSPATGWVRADLVPDEATSQEILRLTKEKEALERLLGAVRLEPPEGTELLAQGDDSFTMGYTYQDALGVYDGTCVATWNEIFSTVSPHMVDEADECYLRTRLRGYVAEATKLPKKFGDRFHEPWLEIRDSDFQTIKIQLRSLGLIRQSIRQRSVKDTYTYWTLTPYGDSVMTRLMAIRKGPDDIHTK